MLLKWLRDPWSLAIDTDGQIGFCLWALQLDGLRIAPYDLHPDGDGSLRALGMTEEAWRTWHDRVLSLAEAASAVIHTGEWPPAERELLLTAGLPYRSWPGEPAVAAWLAELHPRYEQTRSVWQRHFHDAAGVLRPTPRQGRQWWRQLSAAHGALPPARVYLVDYPVPLSVPHPPKTLVIATPFAALDWPTYAHSVVAGIRQLAAV